MKLTKKQIIYIDDYIKYHKVKYWDIRIELLDHIVTSVEEKLEKGISFDDAIIEMHKSFGNSMKMLWNSGIEYSIFANGDGYKDLIQKKLKEINKKHRNFFTKEVINFFKSFKNISLLGTLYFMNYLLFNNVEYILFKRINIIIFFIPSVFILIFFILNFVRKNHSIQLEYSLFYATFPVLLLNMFIQKINPDGIFNVTIEIQKIVMFTVVPLNLVLSYCGLILYIKAHEKYTNIFKQLQSL